MKNKQKRWTVKEYRYTSGQDVKLYRHLVAASENSLFHERHSKKVRHPADILSEEASDISRRFLAFQDTLRLHYGHMECADATSKLVTRLDEFYEQLVVIFKCLTPPPVTESGRLEDALLAANRDKWMAFYGRTKSLHDPIRLAANALKHKGAKIAFARAVNHRGAEVLGFYISHIVGADDLRGPDPEVHPKYRGVVNTAFSYNNFLRAAAGRIFIYMDALDKALFKKGDPIVPSSMGFLDGLVNVASSLPGHFFPDEYAKPYTEIKKKGQLHEVKTSCRYKCEKGENPDHIQTVGVGAALNQRTSTSNSFLPYLQLWHGGADHILTRSPWA
ncbi:hypothetical protein [Lysobacter enzymogenes]|uniref:hypothetical protein n=1 Tax=Lysobacter enzymogenes TaxID=69 RepID=UPI001A96F5FA|nr:hypothetical protein [Lysobacter enzymogenes]QQP97956.1 hypothetical protein JHW38_08120 [Lysobacter enzymogenes]